jgi:alanine dehydrogenase
MDTLILTQIEIERLLTMKDVMRAVKHAFEMHGKNAIQMPPKVYLTFEKGDLRAMPAYLESHAGVKWVNSHPENPSRDLPTVMALLIYSDPKTGFPLAVMDGTHITNMRTGAAGGIAAEFLARKNSRIFGFIGCGTQAYTQLLALKEVFMLEEVKAYDISKSKAKKFIEFCKKMEIGAFVVNAKKVCECDVLTTATPSRKPVVRKEWVEAGTHINAIGADAPGKQELEEEIVASAKIVVDDIQQALHSGEINVPISKGIIKPTDIHATIGEIIIGKKSGREDEEEITIFDSTGLAIQDVATASIVFELASERGIGTKVRFFK